MKIRIDRLRNVRKALKQAPPDALPLAMGQFLYECGTPSCVAGHYFTRPDLQDEFRVFLKRDTAQGPRMVIQTLSDGRYYSGESGCRMETDGPGLWKVMCTHFGLTSNQCENIFGSDGCDDAGTRAEAIRYLNQFIREHA